MNTDVRLPGIYKIESPSGKFYIGSTANIRKRKNEHFGYFARGDHYNIALRSAAKKYGPENMRFSVVVICERSIIREIEQKVIDGFQPAYNLEKTVGNALGDLWLNPEFRAKNSKRCSLQNKKNWQNPAFRLARAGSEKHMQTEEARLKSVESRNRAIAENTEAGLNIRRASAQNGRRLWESEDFRREHSKRLAAGAKRHMAKNKDMVIAASVRVISRAIKLETTGEIFASIKEAAEKKGISVSVIKKQLKGLPTKTGYAWRFLDQAESAEIGFPKKKTHWPDPVYKEGRKPKLVLCKELGIVFPSLKNANGAFGNKDSTAISTSINRKTRAYGYFWEIVEKDSVEGPIKEYRFGELEHLKRDLRLRGRNNGQA